MENLLNGAVNSVPVIATLDPRMTHAPAESGIANNTDRINSLRSENTPPNLKVADNNQPPIIPSEIKVADYTIAEGYRLVSFEEFKQEFLESLKGTTHRGTGKSQVKYLEMEPSVFESHLYRIFEGDLASINAAREEYTIDELKLRIGGLESENKLDSDIKRGQLCDRWHKEEARRNRFLDVIIPLWLNVQDQSQPVQIPSFNTLYVWVGREMFYAEKCSPMIGAKVNQNPLKQKFEMARKWINRATPLGYDRRGIAFLVNAFPQVNARFLETGEGEMFMSRPFHIPQSDFEPVKPTPATPVQAQGPLFTEIMPLNDKAEESSHLEEVIDDIIQGKTGLGDLRKKMAQVHGEIEDDTSTLLELDKEVDRIKLEKEKLIDGLVAKRSHYKSLAGEYAKRG